MIIPETSKEEMDELFADEKKMLDDREDEQVEACVAALKKKLELYTPKDRMRHIVNICREASLIKRGK